MNFSRRVTDPLPDWEGDDAPPTGLQLRELAWKVIDAVRLMSLTTNLGDTRTTITHPATTSHGRLTPEARRRAGITEGLIRIAVGLESVAIFSAISNRPRG
jgi:O-succinylhomoserine sulfhydrylase